MLEYGDVALPPVSLLNVVPLKRFSIIQLTMRHLPNLFQRFENVFYFLAAFSSFYSVSGRDHRGSNGSIEGIH